MILGIGLWAAFLKSGVHATVAGAGWRHILRVSSLAGIGFTISLFIAGLAFGDTPLLDSAKI